MRLNLIDLTRKRGFTVARILLYAVRLAGLALRQSSTALAAATLAVVRCLKLPPDELPARIANTLDVIEWAAAGVALTFIVLDKLDQRREKHRG